MKFRIISLGCPKNLVESEYIAGKLEASGHTMVEDADTVIINTCAFIADAAKESVEMILTEASKQGFDGKIIVTGCLVERYREKLSELIPEVDLFIGRNRYPDIASLIEHRGFFIAEGHFSDTYPRKVFTRPPTAYLKIQEGCNNRCSYCTIPSIRGPLRSRELAEIVLEFQWLLEQGYREVNIIGQDITSYGKDTGSNITDLLNNLLSIKGDYFLRLLYLHPRWISRDLIETIAGEPRIIPYLDVPIQHSEDAILKAMGRGYTKKDLESLMDMIRRVVPRAVLRTSLIVGFPGETDENFQNLCTFIGTWQFDNLGAFMYSKEEKTPAARIKGQVKKTLKQQRHQALMEIQQGISRDRLKRLVGEDTKVIIEEAEGDHMVGRILTQAPDIDGIAFIRGRHDIGAILDGKIVKTLDYDVIVECKQ